MAQVDIRKLVQMPCLRFGDLQFLSLDMDNEVSFDELLDEAANAAEGGDGKARFIDMCAKIFPTVAGSLAAKTAQTLKPKFEDEIRRAARCFKGPDVRIFLFYSQLLQVKKMKEF